MTKHLAGIVGILAVQFGIIFADNTTPLAAKIATLLATSFVLCFADVTKRAAAVNVILSFVALATVVLTFALTKMTATTAAANVVTVALGVLVRLPALLQTTRLPPTAVAIGLGFLSIVSGVCTLASLLLFSAVSVSATSCHSVIPDGFATAVYDCSKINPEKDAALAQVKTCFLAALAGSPDACIAGLVTDLHFAVDEIGCLIAWDAQKNQTKVGLGSASPTDIAVRDAEASWLERHQVHVTNSYPAK